MKFKKILFASMVLCVGAAALADSGTYDYGFSEITRGMGGAGSALPQDTLIAAINPAGMVDVGKRIDLGAVFYFPDISYNLFSPRLDTGLIAWGSLPGSGRSLPLSRRPRGFPA